VAEHNILSLCDWLSYGCHVIRCGVPQKLDKLSLKKHCEANEGGLAVTHNHLVLTLPEG
jgi:hypothetical protein